MSHRLSAYLNSPDESAILRALDVDLWIMNVSDDIPLDTSSQPVEQQEWTLDALTKRIRKKEAERGTPFTKKEILSFSTREFALLQFIDRTFKDPLPLRKFFVFNRPASECLDRYPDLSQEELWEMRNRTIRFSTDVRWISRIYHLLSQDTHRRRAEKRLCELRRQILREGNDTHLFWLCRKTSIPLSEEERHAVGRRVFRASVYKKGVNTTLRLLQKQKITYPDMHVDLFDMAVHRELYNYDRLRSLAQKLGKQPTEDQWRSALFRMHDPVRRANCLRRLLREYPSLRDSLSGTLCEARDAYLITGQFARAEYYGKRCGSPLTAYDVYQAFQVRKSLRKNAAARAYFVKKIQEEQRVLSAKKQQQKPKKPRHKTP